MGRFLIPDWAESPSAIPYASLDNPQSFNLYAYVENNPTTFNDPTGHFQDGGGAHVSDALRLRDLPTGEPSAISFVNYADGVMASGERIATEQAVATGSPVVASLTAFQTGVSRSVVNFALAPLTTGSATGACWDSCGIVRKTFAGLSDVGNGLVFAGAWVLQLKVHQPLRSLQLLDLLKEEHSIPVEQEP
jgi:hypothetical protein